MDAFDVRMTEEYRRVISNELALADVALAQAQNDPDLNSDDIGISTFAANQVARCQGNLKAVVTIIANIGAVPEEELEFHDDGD
jgi:hypothetical protein